MFWCEFIGQVAAEKDLGHVGYVSNLAVAPKNQRKGIARALMRNAEQVCLD